VVLAVLGVSQDVENVDCSRVVVDGCNEAVMVSSDVEDGDSVVTRYVSQVCMGVFFSDFHDGLPFCGLGRDVP